MCPPDLGSRPKAFVPVDRVNWENRLGGTLLQDHQGGRFLQYSGLEPLRDLVNYCHECFRVMIREPFMDDHNEITLHTFAMLTVSELAAFGLASKVTLTNEATPTVYVWRAGDPEPTDVQEIDVRELSRNEVRRVVAAALQRFPGG